MLFALKLILIATLGILVRDDLRMRSIHIGHLVIVGTCLIIPAVYGLAPEDWLLQIGFNLAFIGAQFAILMLFGLATKGKAGLNLFKAIGAGDLVFFALLAIGLSPARFVLFYVSGLTLTLLAFVVLKLTNSNRFETVPTAGFLAAYLGVWQLLEIGGYMGPLYLEPLG